MNEIWIERKSNEDAFRRMKEKSKLWNYIEKRRDQLIGHILKREEIMKTIIEGKLNGKIQLEGHEEDHQPNN